MPSNITRLAVQQPAATATAQLFENGFDPIEAAVCGRVHGFIQAMVEAELDEALSRTRYARHAKSCPGPRSEAPDGEGAGDASVCGHRHGHRSRSLMGTFGEALISVPRARIEAPDGKTREWKSKNYPSTSFRLGAFRPTICPLTSPPDPLPSARRRPRQIKFQHRSRRYRLLRPALV